MRKVEEKSPALAEIAFAATVAALVALAGAARAEGVYAPDADSGQPAAVCTFEAAAGCFIEHPEDRAHVTTDTDACDGPAAATSITVEYAKFAMHSGLARIQIGDGPFERAPLGGATGRDLVMRGDGVSYVLSPERSEDPIPVAVLTSRSVEQTDLGETAVMRVRLGSCADAPVYWSDAFVRGEAE